MIRPGLLVPASLVVAVLIGAAVWSVRQSNWGPVRDDWPTIRQALQDHRWDRAEPALRARVASHPDEGEARLRWGQVLGILGREAESKTALSAIPPGDPNRAAARFLLGEIARKEGDVAEAEAAYREAAQADPDAIPPRTRLLELLFVEWRKPEAVAVLRDLGRLDGDTRHLVARTGLAAERALPHLLRDLGGEVSRFEDRLNDLLQRHPDEPRLRRARGLIALALGEPALAIVDLEFAADRLENDPEGRIALAQARLAIGRPEQAQAALGPPPSDPIDRSLWQLTLGQILDATGKPGEAVDAWKAALEADPRNITAHHRIASALAAQGKADQSADHLARAEAIRPFLDRLKRAVHDHPAGVTDAATCADFAEICDGLGLAIEARDWLRAAVRIDPTRQASQTALAKLAPIEPVEPIPLRDRAAAAPVRPVEPRRSQAPGLSQGLVNRADERGLQFLYDPHDQGDLFIVDTMGGGVALIDFDDDGWLDVYLVNGGPLDPNQAGSNRLFRNRRDGTFADVTQSAGVAGHGYGMGATVGDYDGDGLDDLVVTGYRRITLYRNRGDGTFEDVTDRAGVASDRWSTSAGFADLDGDGDLDLVVITYVDADPATAPSCRDSAGRPIHCPPGRFPAQADHLFRNNGDGTFTDVAGSSGFDAADGRGLGLAIVDVDDDGQLDVYVANDAVPDHLYRNLGGLRFAEQGLSSGVAYGGDGQATASMGVVAEDLDGDGRPDLLHTNFRYEGVVFHRNLGGGLFADLTTAAGLDAPTRPVTGFGVASVDLDNDGDLDLVMANGHVDDLTAEGLPMAQPPQVFEAAGPGRFALATASGYFARQFVGRGLAAGDLDNDGRVDLVIVHRDAPAALLRNEIPGGHWLSLSIRGRSPACRTPVGAVVTARAGDQTWHRRLTAGTSYESAHDRRIHLGLGQARTVDELEIRWPSGSVGRWANLEADRFLVILEGEAQPRVIAGSAR